MLAVPVQDEDTDLATGEPRGRARMWGRVGDSDRWTDYVRAGRRCVRRRVAREKRSTDDHEQDELDGRDRDGDECCGAPRTNGVERCERMIHGEM